MNEAELTQDLRDLLREGEQVTEILLSRLGEDGDAEPVVVVSLLERLALIDERRGRVLERLRAEISSTRKREEERSIRQFVLRALQTIGVPQTTGFLEDYLYATELVEAKSRGMGALRRDEYRAWDRLRDRPRVAYIVPCLDEKGRAIPRWISRSDWSLADRLVVEGAEELWSLHRLVALASAYTDAGTEAEARFAPLIERYAREALGDSVGSIDDSGSDVDELLRTALDRERSLRPGVTELQERVASGFGDLDEAERFWGRMSGFVDRRGRRL